MWRYLIVILGLIFAVTQVQEAVKYEKRSELDKANNNLLYCVICLIVMLVIIQY